MAGWQDPQETEPQAAPDPDVASRLAIAPPVERHYDPDRAAMRAALRVALGLGGLVQTFDEGEDP